jgi:PIN domain nuclease of toxin-antitoxin system
MASVVAGTHAAVWYLANDPRLSRVAGQAMDQATAAGDPILIPAISLVELTYLVKKGRLPQSARQRLIDSATDPEGPYDLVPLDQIVAEAVERIDRAVVPDLPDRVIAATALA